MGSASTANDPFGSAAFPIAPAPADRKRTRYKTPFPATCSVSLVRLLIVFSEWTTNKVRLVRFEPGSDGFRDCIGRDAGRKEAQIGVVLSGDVGQPGVGGP